MTQGTIDAAIMSLDKGYSINIGGGFHHASMYNASGFCVYPDIGLAVKHLRWYFNIEKAMIIDLDAHQGNGHERDFLDDPNVHIIDFYNRSIFPGDDKAKPAIGTHCYLMRDTTDAQFLEAVDKMVTKAIEEFKPQFILYNAGTDIAQNDPLGGLNVYYKLHPDIRKWHNQARRANIQQSNPS